jgi:phosphohistidine phosphatase
MLYFDRCVAAFNNKLRTYLHNKSLDRIRDNNQIAMKRLLILRHAKSSWKDPGLSDHDRPLNKRGRHDAPLMGKLLKDEDLKPDLILSSTATRAKKTAELVAKGCKYKGEIVINQALYRAEPKDYLKILEGISVTYKTVLMVGHSPTIEETIEMITNSSDVIMPTCTLAHIRLPIEKWAEINKQKIKGKLVKIWKPKDLS